MSYFNGKTVGMYQEFYFPNDLYANLSKYWQKCEPLSRINLQRICRQIHQNIGKCMYYFCEVEDPSLLDAR